MLVAIESENEYSIRHISSYLRSLGEAEEVMRHIWLIKSYLEPSQLSNRLTPKVKSTDSLLVVELGHRFGGYFSQHIMSQISNLLR
jgi:hypothetical protein